MITILESQVKLTMSLPELRVLRTVLGQHSEAGLKAKGLSEHEYKVFSEIYNALNDYLVSQA